MSNKVTQRLLSMQEDRLSRRGLLAKFGGVAAGLGLVMTGAAAMPRIAMAAACCVGVPCGTGGFPPCTGGGATCPIGCMGGGTNVCCDRGAVGSTNTVHQCQTCTCGGPICVCEFDSGVPC